MKTPASSPNLEDNICPICLYIFIQPVTMPCEHELCLDCFKQNVEGANFCCPMCRIRISTWARRAAKTKTLVNEKRWRFIQKNFPEQVKNRQEGKEEEDEEMKALNVSIKLAEPGEIRNEYEQQLKQLQAQRLQERQKELEASELLIRKLQEEEKKKEEELQQIARQDEELARKLSQADVDSPGIEQRLRGSESCSSRGAVSDGRQSASNDDSMETFINKMRAENNMSKSPYPYRCLTPVGNGKLCVEKDKVQMMEDHFKRQKIKRDKNLITTQDIANLEEQFKQQRPRPKSSTCTETIDIDHLSRGCESNMSMGMKNLSTTNLNENEILDQMSTGLDVSVRVMEPDHIDDIIVISPSPSPVVVETRAASRSRPSTKVSSTSATSCSYKSPDNDKQERSVSAQSSDSISQELTHFRPIRSCPLTPPRKLPSGKVVEPKLIRTTPRNLMKSESWDQSETNLSDIDGGSPIMQRRLSELAEERKDKVVRLSKSTGTDSENRNPQYRENSPTVDPLIRRAGSSSRNDQFKDISNSPINTKRKLEIEDEEFNPPKKAKVLIPLVPDFDDIHEHNINVPVILPSPKTVPGNNSKDRLSKTKKGKSQKVSYSSSECTDKVGSPQVSILKWMNQKDELRTCVKNDKQEYLIGSKRDEIDGEKRSDPEPLDKTNNAHCSKDIDATTPRHKRPHRMIKSAQKSDYVYEKDRKSASKRYESSSNQDGICSDGESEASDISSDKKKRKLDFDFEDSVPTMSKVKVREPMFKPKPVLKSAKQTKGHSKRNKVVSKKTGNKPEKTMHDFFQTSESQLDGESQEMKDRKMAEELQRQFEMEAKFQLTSIRFKGSSDEYSFRQHRKSKSFFS